MWNHSLIVHTFTPIHTCDLKEVGKGERWGVCEGKGDREGGREGWREREREGNSGRDLHTNLVFLPTTTYTIHNKCM